MFIVLLTIGLTDTPDNSVEKEEINLVIGNQTNQDLAFEYATH